MVPAVMQAGQEYEPEGIVKVHVQKAESEEDCWRYMLKWRRLPAGTPEVKHFFRNQRYSFKL